MSQCSAVNTQGEYFCAHEATHVSGVIRECGCEPHHLSHCEDHAKHFANQEFWCEWCKQQGRQVTRAAN